MTATTWYWIGTAAMALGTVLFGLGAAKVGFGLLALSTLSTVMRNGEFLGDKAAPEWTTVPRRPLA